ncbi:RsfA family transcriptional regulator [Priestia megaterium]|uniref:RsfA family transcriptional regulator n=1 Tax=Priestia TaxID=2800373 RepID=UPI0005C5D52C|nr:RsfA family transcriptional regulator [Priestia megaterium]MDW4510565.1 RsfA family transcriptional regulator [Priestia megaterium]NGY83799.1 RsfA family transcriptional regulator [Priestia megaterium]PEC42963.1 RsfA family transcriptional regulator [Priestia megaterium]CAH0235877.1 Prespore-specific transcriptional regulator RsfA [Priestia megaterium]
MKDRQDAWTEENDLLLAETVLRHVREGSTQLNAFEEVGDELNRTSAACGFRWNAVVRHQYEKALQLAKKQRKQRMRALGQEQGKKKLLYTPPASVEHVEKMMSAPTATYSLSETQVEKSSSEELSMADVIRFLQTMPNQASNLQALQSENKRLMQENTELAKKNTELEKQIKHLEANATTIQEDYETLMQIMNRARKLALFDEEERSSTTFKMDRNGNLEKMAE